MLFRKKNDPDNRILIVSGLPRSGTSLMMSMLDAAGFPPLQDHVRIADDDNPKGYYEFERVKKLPDGDHAWLKDARGKTIKVITALLEHLPKKYAYNVIVMRREMDEILASQKKMLARRGEATNKISDAEMASLFEKHFQKVMDWLKGQKNFRYMEVSYNDLLTEPEEVCKAVAEFLGKELDIPAMIAKIDPKLYRQRAS